MVIDLNGNWRLYQTLPPQHGEILGTITKDFEAGALLKTQAGIYAQLNANCIKSLDQSAVRVALLRAIQVKHSLTRGDIARMLGLTPRQGGSHGTVDMWLSGGRNIPASKLELIEIKAAQLRDAREASK